MGGLNEACIAGVPVLLFPTDPVSEAASRCTTNLFALRSGTHARHRMSQGSVPPAAIAPLALLYCDFAILLFCRRRARIRCAYLPDRAGRADCILMISLLLLYSYQERFGNAKIMERRNLGLFVLGELASMTNACPRLDWWVDYASNTLKYVSLPLFYFSHLFIFCFLLWIVLVIQ